MGRLSNNVWNTFDLRNDDIIVGTYMKSGTTLLQQMVSQVLHKGKDRINVNDSSPWLDHPDTNRQSAATNVYEKQTSRRFIKTHLNYEDLPKKEGVKKIYAIRYGIDVAYSTFKHHCNMKDSLFNQDPNIPIPSSKPGVETAKEYFQEWLKNDSRPWWSYFDSANSVWNHKDDPDLMLIRFDDMQKNPRSTILKIANFINVELSNTELDHAVSHCSFDYMKNNADRIAPAAKEWVGGAKSFFNRGSNGGWKNDLTEVEIKLYDLHAERMLGRECANWIKNGARQVSMLE